MRRRKPNRRGQWGASALVVLALLAGSGCGNTVYAITASSAQARINAAKALGAERYAPYEYWYAKAHLEKSMEEAASADYGDAIDLADTSEQYAEKAIVLSKSAYEGAGR